MPDTVWIFEDQLTLDHPALKHAGKSARVLMIESKTHFSDWPFHKKRLTFLISAMRHFAELLREKGYLVDYQALNDKPYRDSISAIKNHKPDRIHIARPNDHHTRTWVESLEKSLDLKIEWHEPALFLLNVESFSSWARKLKSPVMEHFYRRMRKEHDVLMDGDEPVGGAWNFDRENRKPPTRDLTGPALPSYKPDKITKQSIEDVNRVFKSHPGSADDFDLPVTHDDAEKFFDDFLKHRLEDFGPYEDAMKTGEPVLYHSKISPLINAGLLKPMDCIRAVEKKYEKGEVPLQSVEGFIRQIIGWREYVYGIYQTFMPEYRERNQRKSRVPLPQFYWDAKTKMNCLHQCVQGVIDHAYTHHIQRLMVLCNFATLADIDPQEVNDWFYAMYIDSHDWVVTPNVVGMGMNADHNTMATKPYVSSANYIDKMSDYCGSCSYNAKKRTGEDACPFNYLYWTFLDAHRKELSKNPRMNMILKNLDRMDQNELSRMKKQKSDLIASLKS